MSSNFGYYLFGFGVGLFVGCDSGKNDTRKRMQGQINNYQRESTNKSTKINKYKKFIKSKELIYEFDKFEEEFDEFIKFDNRDKIINYDQNFEKDLSINDNKKE